MSVNKYNSATGKLERIAGGTLYADAPIGTISPFGGSAIPSGYLLCNGQAVNRTTYAELFAVIGTAFGSGNGSTTFNLPDLRETVPVGVGENGNATIANHDIYTLGEFKDDQFQGHNHSNCSIDYNTSSQNNKNYAYAWQNSWARQTDNLDRMVDSGSGTPRTGTTTHGKQLGVNYIIKAKQVAAPADFMDAIDDAISAIKDGTNIDSFADVESAISAVDGKIAFPTISSGNPADIKGLNAQVSKSSNYAVITLLTSSSSSDADKTTIEWDGNNGVVRFRNYINNTKVKEATFMSSEKKQSLVNIDSTYYANTDWNIIKQGNICVMNMRNLKDIPTGNTVIGIIPVGFRPEWGFYEYVYAANKDVHLGFNIGSDGQITILNSTGSAISGTAYVNRNVTYFTA